MEQNSYWRIRRVSALAGFLLAACFIISSCGSQKKMAGEGGTLAADTSSAVVADTADTDTAAVMPRKDLRAVWMATIGGLDWPRGHFDVESQKAFYRRYLDTLQRLNVNAVFFQVRPCADAFYESDYEPWSMYLTWQRDQNPGYDVLRWLIDETHSRGIAFHAWMNPYRIGTRKGRKDHFAPLDKRIPKRLVKDYANVRIYNPALPETRRRICDIVADMLRRYDVDGIHFDDYFYPALAKGEKMNDNREYKRYGKDFADIGDFRRAMVDSLVAGVHRTIKALRPNVLFSISPQGNYENNFGTMYADVEQWSRRGWCDLIIPQLYWSTEKYFPARLQWFADHCTWHSRLAVGYALYRFDGKSRDPYYSSTDDLERQFDLAYNNSKVSGAALYSAHWLLDNPMEIDTVIARRFASPALPPYLGQEPEVRPSSPTGLTVEADGDSVRIAWQPERECYYAIYASRGSAVSLCRVTYGCSATLPAGGTYLITAVRKGDNAESEPVEICTSSTATLP